MRLLSRCNLNVRRKTFKQEQEDQQQWVEARNPLWRTDLFQEQIPMVGTYLMGQN